MSGATTPTFSANEYFGEYQFADPATIIQSVLEAQLKPKPPETVQAVAERCIPGASPE